MNKEKKVKKKCVFCGCEPDIKTKEHIIPKWLIKLTGNINRDINLGFQWDLEGDEPKFKDLKFSFNSFQFPACKECNELYAKLEDDTKPIIIKILADEYIDSYELDTLLDWFDKVRIGLWLGSLYLGKALMPVTPNFHIKERIGKKDRSLLIYKVKDEQKGIQMGGTDLPCFSYNPTCFSLTINNFIFINSSSDYLYSEHLGFPYAVSAKRYLDTKMLYLAINNGTNRIGKKLFPNSFPDGGTRIIQPIIQCDYKGNLIEEFNNDYITNNSLKKKPMHGLIFIENGKRIEKLEEDEEMKLTPALIHERRELINKIIPTLIKEQLYIFKNSRYYKSGEITKESKVIFEGQNMFLNLAKKNSK